MATFAKTSVKALTKLVEEFVAAQCHVEEERRAYDAATNDAARAHAKSRIIEAMRKRTTARQSVTRRMDSGGSVNSGMSSHGPPA